MGGNRESIQELLKAIDRGEPHQVEVVTISEKKGFVQLKMENPPRSVVVSSEVYERIREHLHEQHPELRNAQEADDTYVPDPEAQAERARRRAADRYGFNGGGRPHTGSNGRGGRPEEESKERDRQPVVENKRRQRPQRQEPPAVETRREDVRIEERRSQGGRNNRRGNRRNAERSQAPLEPAKRQRAHGQAEGKRKEHTPASTGTKPETSGSRTGGRAGARARESHRRNAAPAANHTNG